MDHHPVQQKQVDSSQSEQSTSEGAGKSLAPPTFQLMASDGADAPPVQRKPESGGLPGDLVNGFAASTGHDLSNVNVHRNSDKPSQVGALAYAQGNDIHLGAGQDQHLAHEAAHIVQQREGRVQANTEVSGMPVNDSRSLESEADSMGAKAMQMKAAKEPQEGGNEPTTLASANVSQRMAHTSGCGCGACAQAAQLKEKPAAQLRSDTVFQLYAEENDHTVFQGDETVTTCPLTLEQLFQIFTMTADSLAFDVQNRDGERQTVRFTREWSTSFAGTAVLRGRIRYEIDQAIGARSAEIEGLINALTGDAARIEELRQYRTQSLQRFNAHGGTTVDSSEALIEEGLNDGQSFQCRGYNYTRFGGPNTNNISWTVNSWDECLQHEPEMRSRIRAMGYTDADIESWTRQRLADGPGRNAYNTHLVRLHAAWDINGPEGTGVYAPIEGVVDQVMNVRPNPEGRTSPGYGNFVRIRHETVPAFSESAEEGGGGETAEPQVVYTNYCHLAETLVTEGMRVHPGQAIGLMGHSGLPSGSHLHFSVVNSPSTSSETEVESSINPRTWWTEVTGNDSPYVSQVTASESAAHSRSYTRERSRAERRSRRARRATSAEAPVQPKLAENQPVMQQQAHDKGCGCNTCAAQMKEHTAQAAKATAQLQTAGVIQRVPRPDYLVSHRFMGVTVERDVHPLMRDRLVLVEAELQRQYDALDPTTRPASLQLYAGLQSIRGWRNTTSLHGTGSAVDVNYHNQPYIATRTPSDSGGRTVYGGEGGARATRELRALRQPATEVYDRAVGFVRTNPYDDETADVSHRDAGESATSAYRRFRFTSDSLASYLSLAFRTNYDTVRRRPVPNAEGATEADLLRAIPTTERKDEAAAIADIQAFMDDEFWRILHPDYALTARETYIRMLRDYEVVRIPMERGDPDVSPAETRNPALGFLHMHEHFVVAMMETGNLRWGACDFGANSNGDVHHFDLGADGVRP